MAQNQREVLAQGALLRLKGRDQVEWESYAWEPEGHRQTRGPSRPGVATFARRVMAVERARVQRRGPADLVAYLRRNRQGKLGRKGEQCRQ